MSLDGSLLTLLGGPKRKITQEPNLTKGVKTFKTIAVIGALWGVGYLCLGAKDGLHSDLPSILQFAKETFVGGAVAWFGLGTAVLALGLVCLIAVVLRGLWLLIKVCWKFDWAWKTRRSRTPKTLISEGELRGLITGIHLREGKAPFDDLMARCGELTLPEHTNTVDGRPSRHPREWAGIGWILFNEVRGMTQGSDKYLTKDFGFGAFDIRVPYLAADAKCITRADIQFSRPSLAPFLNLNRGLVKWLLALIDEFYGRPANSDWFKRDIVKSKGDTEYHYDAYKCPKGKYAQHYEWVSEWSLYDLPDSKMPGHVEGDQLFDIVVIRFRQRTATQIADCRSGADGYRWVRGVSKSV